MSTSLPCRASAKDFYACGARVQIPSIKVSNKTTKRHKSVTTVSPLARLGSENSVSRRRHTTGGERESFRSHVGHLKQSLTFSDDVVSTLSPQAVSYSHARGRLAHVFRAGPANSSTGGLAGGGVRLLRGRGDVGRRDCRGEARQHPLCHLRRATVPHTERDGDRHLPVKLRPGVAPLTQRSSSLRPPLRSDVPSYPSGMLYRGLRVVPVSRSVQWEDELLQNVTSSTAARLGARRKAGKKEDEEEEEESEAMMEREKPKSSVKGELDDEVEERYRGCKVEEYVRSLKEGAKPVSRRVGERGRIVLDNDTTFTKV